MRAIPILGRNRVDRLARPARTGIVEQHIDAPGIVRRLQKGRDIGNVGHVGAQKMDTPVGGFGKLMPACDIDIADPHLGPFAHQPERGGTPYP